MHRSVETKQEETAKERAVVGSETGWLIEKETMETTGEREELRRDPQIHDRPMLLSLLSLYLLLLSLSLLASLLLLLSLQQQLL